MKGILFTPEMARAACSDTKTLTRRVINPQPPVDAEFLTQHHGRWQAKRRSREIRGLTLHLGEFRCDYQVGERRCLLTTWAVGKTHDRKKPLKVMLEEAWGSFWHAGMGAPKPQWAGKLRPGRFLPNHLRCLMPRFEIVSVHAERVQDITETDAKAEGVTEPKFVIAVLQGLVGGKDYRIGNSLRGGYCCLWGTINAKRGFGWSNNPWVWVVEFRRVVNVGKSGTAPT